VIKWPVKLYVRFFTSFTFFKIQKKHDFLRFFELLHTFSRTVTPLLTIFGLHIPRFAWTRSVPYTFSLLKRTELIPRFICNPGRNSCACFGLYTEDPNFCSGRSDGLYLVVGNCSIYYRCARNVTYIRACPSGNIFSGLRKQCVPEFRARPQEKEMCNASELYRLSITLYH